MIDCSEFCDVFRPFIRIQAATTADASWRFSVKVVGLKVDDLLHCDNILYKRGQLS